MRVILLCHRIAFRVLQNTPGQMWWSSWKNERPPSKFWFTILEIATKKREKPLMVCVADWIQQDFSCRTFLPNLASTPHPPPPSLQQLHVSWTISTAINKPGEWLSRCQQCVIPAGCWDRNTPARLTSAEGAASAGRCQQSQRLLNRSDVARGHVGAALLRPTREKVSWSVNRRFCHIPPRENADIASTHKLASRIAVT